MRGCAAEKRQSGDWRSQGLRRLALSLASCGFSWWGDGVADQAFDAGPEDGIALDGDVGFDEDALEPGVGAAFFWRVAIFVGITKISQNLSACGIGGVNFFASVEHAVWLVEIDGAGDVVGDYRVILAVLFDAIDLNGQEDRNAVFAKLIGERHYGGGAPTVSVQDDSGAAFFLIGERAGQAFRQRVFDGVAEAMQDFLVGVFEAAILEDGEVGVRRVGRPQTLGNYEFVAILFVGDFSAHEADDDGLRRIRIGCRGGGIGGRNVWRCTVRQCTPGREL